MLVYFPWGSLARGLLGIEAAPLAGTASLLRPGGGLEALVSITEPDSLRLGVAPDRLYDRVAIHDAWLRHGLELLTHRLATEDELSAARTTWARRLHGFTRPVVRLNGIRLP